MERYVESRLTDLHHAGVKSHFKQKFLASLVSICVLVFLPYLHLGVFYRLWSNGKPAVDRAHCTCDCFDTIFRGRYEWPPSAYKHLYFNSTSNTLKIWIVVLLGVISLYECLRYLCPLIWTKRVRMPMLALFIASLYPHYYGWWGMFSYLNEDYYAQWYHQMFFSLTEALSTAVVVHLCNADNKLEPWKLLLIISINVIHIIVGSLDQFIDNVIYHKGAQFEALRDFGLMIPDAFHVLVSYFELSSLAGLKRVNIFKLFHREELMTAALLIILLSLLGKNM